MSEVFSGAIEITRRQVGMISLRGDVSQAGFANAVTQTLGAALPGQRRVTTGTNSLVWMSPDELLAVVPYSEAPALTARLQEALTGVHSLAVDVSDARAVFSLKGAGWREVLAKGAPVDLATDAFGLGDMRRTRLGQVAAAFWCSGADQAELVCFRSVGSFVFDWLKLAAHPGTLPEVLT